MAVGTVVPILQSCKVSVLGFWKFSSIAACRSGYHNADLLHMEQVRRCQCVSTSSEREFLAMALYFDGLDRVNRYKGTI